MLFSFVFSGIVYFSVCRWPLQHPLTTFLTTIDFFTTTFAFFQL